MPPSFRARQPFSSPNVISATAPGTPLSKSASLLDPDGIGLRGAVLQQFQHLVHDRRPNPRPAPIAETQGQSCRGLLSVDTSRHAAPGPWWFPRRRTRKIPPPDCSRTPNHSNLSPNSSTSVPPTRCRSLHSASACPSTCRQARHQSCSFRSPSPGDAFGSYRRWCRKYPDTG